jgi:cell division initiation protein
MTITPQDIQSKQFHVRLRGFDVDEVDKFLEKVAEEFLLLSMEHKQAMEKIASLDKEVANFRNKEQAFQNAILSAQKISDEMQGKSRREADEMLEKAREEAAELEAKSLDEAETMLSRAAQEAEAIKEKAISQARSLVENSSSRMLELTNEINHLISMKKQIAGDLHQLLDGYRQRLEEGLPAGLNNLEPLPEPQPIDDFMETAFAGPEEEVEGSAATENTASGSGNEDDLESLYEKIDLPDGELDNQADTGTSDAEAEEEMATLELADIEALELDEDQSHEEIAIRLESDLNFNADIPIPELGEDMLFSLEDPLDELEPSISIRGDRKSADEA